MAVKSYTILASLVLFLAIASAIPPACVLQAVNGANTSPNNVKQICSSGSTIEQSLVSDCGPNLDAAMSAFSSICNEAGVKISTWGVASSSAVGLETAGSSSATATGGVKSSAVSTSASGAETVVVQSTGSAVTATGVVISTGSDVMTSTESTSLTLSTSTAATSATSTGLSNRLKTNSLAIAVLAAGRVLMAF